MAKPTGRGKAWKGTSSFKSLRMRFGSKGRTPANRKNYPLKRAKPRATKNLKSKSRSSFMGRGILKKPRWPSTAPFLKREILWTATKSLKSAKRTSASAGTGGRRGEVTLSGTASNSGTAWQAVPEFTLRLFSQEGKIFGGKNIGPKSFVGIGKFICEAANPQGPERFIKSDFPLQDFKIKPLEQFIKHKIRIKQFVLGLRIRHAA